MGVANAECYIESDINSFYLCEKDFVMKHVLILLYSFFIITTIGYLHRMGVANTECYIYIYIYIYI